MSAPTPMIDNTRVNTITFDIAFKHAPHTDRKRRRKIATLFALATYGGDLKGFRHRARRNYLTRAMLMPYPRLDSPWVVLYDSQNDAAFITTMGIDVATFNFLLDSGFREGWLSNAIPRNDVDGDGFTRPGRRSLDAAGALGLLLHYLSGTMTEVTLQQLFAVVPSVLSRYITFSLGILLAVLRYIPDGRIAWPFPEEMAESAQVIHERHNRIDGAFGFIDGLNLPVGTSSDPAIENSTYNGWLHAHKVSNVLVFSPNGTVIAAKVNAPGSWHDSRVATHIYDKLLNNTPDGFFLLADTAFPRNDQGLANKIHTPLKQGSRFPPGTTQAQAARLIAYSNAVTSARQAAEWGMRAIQGAYGRLRVPLDINNPVGRRTLIETCLRLHNVGDCAFEVP